MLPRSFTIGLSLSLLTLAGVGASQVGPTARTLGPEFNPYNADFIPENHPSIAELRSEMSVEEATAILQSELVGAQFFGLDGVMAEHWGPIGIVPVTPQAAAVQTLVADQEGLSWQSMVPGEEEVLARFAFEDAVQIWSRFSMAERDASTDPPTDSPQGVVLYLLTADGADDVYLDPIAYSKIVPSYPNRLPAYGAKGRARTLTTPGIFVEDGNPSGFAVCCFSSTGFGDGEGVHLSLERLPLVIAAFMRLSPNLEVRDNAGLLLSVPLSFPQTVEVDTILTFCNSAGFHNQGVPLCHYSQLQGLAYMKLNETLFPELARGCALEWPGDYRTQGECVDFSMMNHFIMPNPAND